MLRFKSAIQFVERYHSVVSYAMNMNDLFSNNFVNSICDKEISKVFYVNVTNQLSDIFPLCI
jgi:hypothetical protein